MYIIGVLLISACTKHPTPGKPIEKDNGQPTESADVELARGADHSKPLSQSVYSPKMPIVLFDFDSDRIHPKFTEDISYALMRSKADWVCQVDGHASAEGTEEYNLALGWRRANQVAAYMATFQGIATVTTSYGETQPALSPELSRRVEIRCK